MANRHKVIHLAADADFTGSIFKVCSAHATSTTIENSHFGSYDFSWKDTYGNSLATSTEPAGGWSGSAYLSVAGDIIIPSSQCLETDMIAVEAKTNAALVYYRSA
jgi:hypothetical protein